MKVGKAIYDILTNDAAVQAIYSSKIYPVQIPQNTTWPAMSYTVISQVPDNDKDGVSVLDSVRIQLDMYAQTYSDLADHALTVRQALDRAVAGTYATVIIDGVSFIIGSDSLVEELEVLRKIEDYQIRVKNPAKGGGL